MNTNSGASKAPAESGSMTIDNSGMPTMAKPPPKAPFIKAIKNTPAKARTMVAISMDKGGIRLIAGNDANLAGV